MSKKESKEVIDKISTRKESKEVIDKMPTRNDILDERLKELDAKMALYDSKLKELEFNAKIAPSIKTEKKESNQSDKKKRMIQISKDYEKVRGRFKFYEVPKGTLSFVFQRYKEKPMEKYTMIDGETYEVPRIIAEHLNTSGRYPIHEHAQMDSGIKVRIGKKIARYGFESLDFVRIEESNPVKEISTVEYL